MEVGLNPVQDSLLYVVAGPSYDQFRKREISPEDISINLRN